jgi:hypothetical protein
MATILPWVTVKAMTETSTSGGDDDASGAEGEPDRVVRVAQRAKHLVGDRPQVLPVLLELLSQLAIPIHWVQVIPIAARRSMTAEASAPLQASINLGPCLKFLVASVAISTPVCPANSRAWVDM